MKERTEFLVGFCSIAVGLFGIGCAIVTGKKHKNICRKLDMAIDDISEDIDVNVSEKVVNKAIEKAVNKSVREQVDRAVNLVVDSTRKDINNQVILAMKALYPDIRKTCAEKVSEEISKINARDLTDVIREEAKEKALEKFNGQLDDILDRFNTDLDNVTKIYSSITKKIIGNESNNLKISLG